MHLTTVERLKGLASEYKRRGEEVEALYLSRDIDDAEIEFLEIYDDIKIAINILEEEEKFEDVIKKMKKMVKDESNEDLLLVGLKNELNKHLQLEELLDSWNV